MKQSDSPAPHGEGVHVEQVSTPTHSVGSQQTTTSDNLFLAAFSALQCTYRVLISDEKWILYDSSKRATHWLSPQDHLYTNATHALHLIDESTSGAL